jgi:hypothetical protein
MARAYPSNLMSPTPKIASAEPASNVSLMAASGTRNPLPTRRKPSFPIKQDLRAYLRRYRRELELPVTYERLRAFHEVIPLTDDAGRPTLWDTVIYDANEMPSLNDALKEIYAWLKVDGDLSVVSHLYVDRVDFCTFGNSTPFRIRIVNAYNDNQDYFYVKQADASRTPRAFTASSSSIFCHPIGCNFSRMATPSWRNISPASPGTCSSRIGWGAAIQSRFASPKSW